MTMTYPGQSWIVNSPSWRRKSKYWALRKPVLLFHLLSSWIYIYIYIFIYIYIYTVSGSPKCAIRSNRVSLPFAGALLLPLFIYILYIYIYIYIYISLSVCVCVCLCMCVCVRVCLCMCVCVCTLKAVTRDMAGPGATTPQGPPGRREGGREGGGGPVQRGESWSPSAWQK